MKLQANTSQLQQTQLYKMILSYESFKRIHFLSWKTELKTKNSIRGQIFDVKENFK